MRTICPMPSSKAWEGPEPHISFAWSGFEMQEPVSVFGGTFSAGTPA